MPRGASNQKFPKEIRHGSFIAKLYQAKRTVNGRDYEIVRLSYYLPGGTRKVRDFSTEAKARKAAEEASKAYALGRMDALSFSRAEREEYDAARKALEGTGITVYQAAVAVADEWHKRPTGLQLRSVAEVVEEYLVDLKRRGVSDEYLLAEKKVGAHFSKAFNCPLSSVTPDIFRAWLWSLKKRDGKTTPSGRSLYNIQRAFIALANFAARRKYLRRDHAAELSEMEAPQKGAPKCGIFTVEAFRKLLVAADELTLPAFVLGGMAGVRTAEIGRIQWSDVDLTQKVVTIGSHVAKTQSRRVIPLCEAALAWLAPFANATGPVLTVDPREMVKVATAAGVPWVKNGLRHSFCSHRLAVLKNAAEVAFEAGNSPSMIQAHYRSLVTEATGKAWFDIRPATPSNVISLPAAATA